MMHISPPESFRPPPELLPLSACIPVIISILLLPLAPPLWCVRQGKNKHTLDCLQLLFLSALVHVLELVHSLNVLRCEFMGVG